MRVAEGTTRDRLHHLAGRDRRRKRLPTAAAGRPILGGGRLRLPARPNPPSRARDREPCAPHRTVRRHTGGTAPVSRRGEAGLGEHRSQPTTGNESRLLCRGCEVVFAQGLGAQAATGLPNRVRCDGILCTAEYRKTRRTHPG